MEKFDQNLDAKQLAYLMQADKMLLKNIGSTCFKRCIITYQTEYLNDYEMNCIDRSDSPALVSRVARQAAAGYFSPDPDGLNPPQTP